MIFNEEVVWVDIVGWLLGKNDRKEVGDFGEKGFGGSGSWGGGRRIVWIGGFRG